MTCAPGVAIPASLHTTGVPNTDYYVFFSARPTLSNLTIATATPCNMDPIDGHPSVGYVNFNPSYFQSMPAGKTIRMPHTHTSRLATLFPRCFPVGPLP